MIVHDTRQGFSFWDEATNSEIYGSIVYYNGWQRPDDGHGHGVYGQNQCREHQEGDRQHRLLPTSERAPSSTVRPRRTSTTSSLEGNTIFLNGIGGDFTRNVLVGGEGQTLNPKLISNSLYYAGGPTTALKLGLFGSNCQSPTVTNNYIANNVAVYCSSMTITGNTLLRFDPGIHAGPVPGQQLLLLPADGREGLPAAEPVRDGSRAHHGVQLGRAVVRLRRSQLDPHRPARPSKSATRRTCSASPSCRERTTDLRSRSRRIWRRARRSAGPRPRSQAPISTHMSCIAAPGPNEFLDVFPSNPHHDDIVTLAAAGVTAGCGSGDYCPTRSFAVTRWRCSCSAARMAAA